MALTWRLVCLLASVLLFVLAAFGVGDGDLNLVLLAVGAYVASLIDVNSPRPPA